MSAVCFGELFWPSLSITRCRRALSPLPSRFIMWTKNGNAISGIDNNILSGFPAACAGASVVASARQRDATRPSLLKISCQSSLSPSIGATIDLSEPPRAVNWSETVGGAGGEFPAR